MSIIDGAGRLRAPGGTLSAGRTAGGVFIVLCCVLCVGHCILSSTLLYSTLLYCNASAPRWDID